MAIPQVKIKVDKVKKAKSHSAKEIRVSYIEKKGHILGVDKE